MHYKIILGGWGTRRGGVPYTINVESDANPDHGIPRAVADVLDAEFDVWHVLGSAWPSCDYTVYSGTDRTRCFGGYITYRPAEKSP